MKATIAIILTISQAILFWLAWTGDVARHDRENRALRQEIEMVNKRCDSLCMTMNMLEKFQGDTIIVNVPQPIVKVITTNSSYREGVLFSLIKIKDTNKVKLTMKQFTSIEQTAKLIELGFEKPKNIEKMMPQPVVDGYVHLVPQKAYSIGELIEMLLSKPHCRVSIYNVGLKQHKVLFKKLINGKFKVLFREVGYEPIDLLFNCIVKLKGDGVI